MTAPVRALALAALLLLAAGAPFHARANTLRVADQGDVMSMDPYMINEALLLSFMGNVYEGLTGRGRKLETTAELATDWKQTAPTVWRFNLRRGVKFHDGTPFTADDVIFSLERARGEGSDVKTYVAPIKEIRKVDSHAIDIVTHEPYPILPQAISVWYILSKQWCEKNNAVRPVDVRKGTENFASTRANGTGPFRLKSREPGVRTVLQPNPEWWGKPEHNLTEVVFTPISNDATRVAALLSGEIDMMQPVPLQDVPRLQGNAALKVAQGGEIRTIFLGMDQKRDELLGSNVKGKNPFKDRRVRQAFYQAIDVEAIRARIMRGASRPTGLLIAPEVQGFSAELNRRLPFDPEAARALLAEAGYPGGFEVAMNCPNDRYVNDAEICQAIASMLAKVGVRINLAAETKTLWFPRVLRRDTAFYLFGWVPASQDAHNALFALVATPGEAGQGQFNLGAYSNTRIDQLTRQIAAEADMGKRNGLIAEAFRLTQEDVAYIPLHQQPLTWGMKKNVDMVQLANNFNYFRWATVK
ncbi:MAG: ABC transporter substrate-binding protein [Betaproteobacteria bacterium]|jgi:peptide/nickel transport system substrate-binding protein|nr:ABC transporter substrate-binding protein [Rhodocyclaceae bacterium]MCE2899253.1 ABC transporter substrate-binding protein [Betaproteobacteria bacterium]